MSSIRLATFGWGAAFVCGMFGVPIVARLVGLDGRWVGIAMILPMTLLIPFVRAAGRLAQVRGCASPALDAYNRRFVVASFLYVAALMLAVYTTSAFHPVGVAAWLLAILPAVPVLAMIWTVARYLVEEQDEYLRSKMVNAVLVGTGLLLALSTCWGFLETFGLVPHVPAWAAMPLWAVGSGAGRYINRMGAWTIA